MTIMGKIRNKLPTGRRFLHDRRGASAVEFAFMIPLLLVMYLGTLELGQGIETNKKISRSAAMIGDLVTQEQLVTRADVDAMLAIGASILQPYQRSRPTITVTGVKMDANSIGKVAWSRKIQNGTTSGTGATNDTIAVPANLKTPGGFLVYVKADLTYMPVLTSVQNLQKLKSLGYTSAFASIPMSEGFFLSPRQSKEVTCTNC